MVDPSRLEAFLASKVQVVGTAVVLTAAQYEGVLALIETAMELF